MKPAVVLDAGPIGLLTNPHPHPVPTAIRQWLVDLEFAGRRVVLPEISDYEIRREYLRARMRKSLRLLDRLARQIEYAPITTAIMRRAADLWAQARQTGRPTAPDLALDADMILAATALELGVPVIVATGNAAHLSRFVPAADWTAIPA